MKLHRWTAILPLSILLHINKIAACGQLQNVLESRITFGQATHRWPWHAAIYHKSDEIEFIYKCGGTLASSAFVLTAAHCVSVAADLISVSLGRLYLDTSQSSAPFIKVADILVHPNYRPENYANDIAIITLATDAIFNSYVQPVCLWRSSKTDLSEVIGKFGTVVGWGFTEDSKVPNVLQEASLPVVSQFTCLESNRDLFGRLLTFENFCAGTQNGTSVCTGDSGGSITFQEDGRFYIRGIVSVGASKIVDQSANKYMCDSMQYAIFTDVAKYLPWIRTTIGYEIAARCDWRSFNFTCTAFLDGDVRDIGCKTALNQSSEVDVQRIYLTGHDSTAVPDLSCAVDNFMKLEYVSLHRFTRVERSTMSALKSIRELYIRNFNFMQIDAETFADLNDVLKISLIEITVTSLPAGIFRNNNKIRSLELSVSSLHVLHCDVFENLRNVEYIKLDNNLIDTLPANIFRNNEKVATLQLSSNSFKEVHEDLFNGLTNLVTVDLSSNLIEHLPSGLFRSNAKLAYVYFLKNRIRRMDVDLTTMPQLASLQLGKNDCIDENFQFPEQSLSEASEKIRRNCGN